mgnify:FL=1
MTPKERAENVIFNLTGMPPDDSKADQSALAEITKAITEAIEEERRARLTPNEILALWDINYYTFVQNLKVRNLKALQSRGY